ncbi:MAG: sigma-70 family RNA polymerase sigma factor [Acidimicrobiales bacterium]
MKPTTETTVEPQRPWAAEFALFYAHELDGQVRRAFLLVGSNEAANDVVHDAFVAVYRRWGEIERPGPYLNRVVLNGCRDLARRRRRTERLLAVTAATGEAAEISDRLDDVLERLPFNQRAAIVLRFYGQLSVVEIADALDCPPGSVGPWIDRGLKKMRKALS